MALHDRVQVLVLKIFFKILLPFLLIYLVVWQSITYANLNRKVKKLSKKREDLIKKNFDLKARVATSSSAERIENLFRKNNKDAPVYLGNKIITLTLPKEGPIGIRE